MMTKKEDSGQVVYGKCQCSHRPIPSDKLHAEGDILRFFKTNSKAPRFEPLRLHPPTQIALPAHTPHRTLTLNTSYTTAVPRVSRSGAHRCRWGSGTQQAGSRDEENNVFWDWRWGPRTAAKIGKVAVEWFIAEFMAECANRGSAGRGGGPGRSTGGGVGSKEGSDEELGGRRARARRIARRRRKDSGCY